MSIDQLDLGGYAAERILVDYCPTTTERLQIDEVCETMYPGATAIARASCLWNDTR